MSDDNHLMPSPGYGLPRSNDIRTRPVPGSDLRVAVCAKPYGDLSPSGVRILSDVPLQRVKRSQRRPGLFIARSWLLMLTEGIADLMGKRP